MLTKFPISFQQTVDNIKKGGVGGGGEKLFVSFTLRLIEYFFRRNNDFRKSVLISLKMLVAPLVEL